MINKPCEFRALKRVLSAFGTQAECAAALGVTQPSVSRWVNSTRRMPAELVLTAERLTGVSRHELRPDIYPREVMTDQAVGARFMGTDRAAGSRRLTEGGLAT